MKSTLLICASLALIAAVCALPIAEESWYAEDELLARVHSDATPFVLMQTTEEPDTSASAEEAQGEANTLNNEADDAEVTEDAQAALEAKYEASAAQSKAAMDDAAADADAHNAAASEAADATQEHADAASVAAGLANDNADDKAAADKAAFDATVDRNNDEAQGILDANAKANAETAAGIKANDDAIAAQHAHADAIAQAAGEAADANQDAQDAAHKQYADTVAQNAEDNKAQQDALDNEAEEDAAAYAAKKAANDAAASAEDKALNDEAAANAATNKANSDAINAKYAKIDAAAAAADAAGLKNYADADAASTEKAQKFQDKADELKAKNDDIKAKADDVAAKMKQDADDAQQASVDKAASDVKNAEATKAAADHKAQEDAAMANCEDPEGKDRMMCVSGDGECHFDGEDGKFWVKMAVDGEEYDMTCADTNQYNAGAASRQAAIKAPDAFQELPAPSAECLDKKKAFEEICPDIVYQTYADGEYTMADTFPIVTLACDADVHEDCHTVKAAKAFFDMGSACVDYCKPGTAEVIKGEGEMADQKVNNGICITSDAIGQMKNQIVADYEASGTNGRFPAGGGLSICKLATSIVDGIEDGSA